MNKLTQEQVNQAVERYMFVQPEGTTLTLCVLQLKNGFCVTGESGCVCPDEFNRETGEHLALKNALDKVWLMEGYLLKQRLFEKDHEII